MACAVAWRTCFNGVPRPPWRAGGAFWVSHPQSPDFGEDWYRAPAPFPGGALLGAGARFGVDIRGLAAGATLGVSVGELTQPGWLADLEGSASAGALQVALLAGACSAAYRTPTRVSAD